MDAPEAEEKTPVTQGHRIVPRLIDDEMKQSYIDYSMSVIVGRALPDVRDGLKPVHRRILFAMQKGGLLHNRPYKKSAHVVGNVLAETHPHGDMAVYDSMVRMAQDFSLRYTLLDGQGNWGSIDGDSAAAYRYTEVRLRKIAEEMLQDLDKETVKFVPNFDESSKEPSVLPAKLPNLLINGSSGIAVGMATNIPPHNINEVCQGIIRQIENPDITAEELMQTIKGPDFPTGGTICGSHQILSMYGTGRGKLTIRAKVEIDHEKNRIEIIEIPYFVNKAEMIIQIAELVKEKKIIGIHDIRDESDGAGISVMIELKQDANPEIIINQLYKHTRLQTTFSVSMLALVDNEPKVLTLKQIISEYIKHRKDVVIKRTEFEKAKAEKRAHILEGLIKALSDIDTAVRLIKKSKSVQEAKALLIAHFTLSDEQAIAILDMKLQRLTSLEQDKIRIEHSDLQKLIGELNEILGSEDRVKGIIIKELEELRSMYGDERKTCISDEGGTCLGIEDLIRPQEMVLTVSHAGYIKRQPLDSYRMQHRGGRGIMAMGTKDDDFVSQIFVANTHSYILFFTDKGKVHWLKVYQIPEAGRQSRGKAIVNLLELSSDEHISAFIPVPKFDEGRFLMMATQHGTVKKTSLGQYARPRRGGIIGITLEDDDRLINVVETGGNSDIVLATEHGMAIRFKESDVRPAGRSAKGMRGIALKGDDKVISMVIASQDSTILTITRNGFGKRTPVSEYRLINRGGVGVRNIICSDRNGPVAAVRAVDDSHEMMIMSRRGVVIRISVKDLSTIGRSTQGVRLMRLEENDTVASAARIVLEEEEPKVAQDNPSQDMPDGAAPLQDDNDPGSDGLKDIDNKS